MQTVHTHTYTYIHTQIEREREREREKDNQKILISTIIFYANSVFMFSLTPLYLPNKDLICIVSHPTHAVAFLLASVHLGVHVSGGGIAVLFLKINP